MTDSQKTPAPIPLLQLARSYPSNPFGRGRVGRRGGGLG